MTDPAKCVCKKPADHGYLCGDCLTELDQVVADLGTLLHEARVVIARQDHLVKTATAPRTQLDDVEDWDPRITLVANPLPVNTDAVELVDKARAELRRWIRAFTKLDGLTPYTALPAVTVGPTCRAHVHTRGGECRNPHCPIPHHCRHASCTIIRRQPAPDADRYAVTWLLNNTGRIAQATADVKPALRSLRRWRNRLERFVFGDEPDVYAGPCDEPDEVHTIEHDGQVTVTIDDTRVCGTHLYARFGDTEVICDTCGARYDIADRKAYMERVVRDLHLRQAQIVAALRAWGSELTADRLEKWIARDRAVYEGALAGGRPVVWRHPPVLVRSWDAGRPCYRVGDVLDRLESQAAAATVAAARRERRTA